MATIRTRCGHRGRRPGEIPGNEASGSESEPQNTARSVAVGKSTTLPADFDDDLPPVACLT